jgi:hypothetical protein
MKVFSVQEIKTRLIAGASDEDLMQTYGLSPAELKTLLGQLIVAVAQCSTYVRISEATN